MSKLDSDRAAINFENFQKQKQSIMDVCEKRNQEV